MEWTGSRYSVDPKIRVARAKPPRPIPAMVLHRRHSLYARPSLCMQSQPIFLWLDTRTRVLCGGGFYARVHKTVCPSPDHRLLPRGIIVLGVDRGGTSTWQFRLICWESIPLDHPSFAATAAPSIHPSINQLQPQPH
jgi:hypothetical protein